ncbi:MAG TPA: energy transducer TonB, partial [Candidatus Eremiobacteraceae bacterium]|nr:energy transducer TonB [Candidatus Eremiobacteraceae bacterium]
MTVSDFTFVGQSASGKTSVYSFDVSAPDNRPFSAHISALESGKNNTVLLVPRSPFLDKLPKCCGSATLERFGSPISAMRVVDYKYDSDARYTPCSAQAVRLGEVWASSNIVVFPDNAAVTQINWGGYITHGPHHIQDANFKNRVQPEYPLADSTRSIAGDVVVLVDVTPEGKVENAVVMDSSQDEFLDQAAEEAASESTFIPATADGVPVRRQYRIAYLFSLPGGREIRPNNNCGVHISS